MSRILFILMFTLISFNANALVIDCKVINHIELRKHEISNAWHWPHRGNKFRLRISDDSVETDNNKLFPWKSKKLYFKEDDFLLPTDWSVRPDRHTIISYEDGIYVQTFTMASYLSVITADCF